MAKSKNFEENIKELEEIVLTLENGETTLEESLKLFEQGIKLSKGCQAMLDKAQQKVTVLLESENGEVTEEDFAELKTGVETFVY